MPDYDAGFKIVARAAGPHLGGLAGLHCDEWEPIGGEVQATERLADRAFLVRQRQERFVVYVEAYTRWSNAAPWSLLSKSGLLAERQRLPVYSLVFVLLPRGFRSLNGRFRLVVGRKPTQQLWFREICLWQQRPASWWEESPGLMPLYPLCRHKLPRRQAIEHAAAAISRGTTDRVSRATLLTTLAIFGRLAYRDLPVMDLIGREAMKESPFFEEVMAEGRIEQLRADVKQAIDIRFGRATAEEFSPILERISDSEHLSELLGLAIRCRRASEFRRALRTDVPSA